MMCLEDEILQFHKNHKLGLINRKRTGIDQVQMNKHPYKEETGKNMRAAALLSHLL